MNASLVKCNVNEHVCCCNSIHRTKSTLQPRPSPFTLHPSPFTLHPHLHASPSPSRSPLHPHQVPYDHLISIGFLNERPDGRKHGDAFDAVVCGNTGSVYPVADLVEDIVSAKSGVSAAFRRALSGSREGLLDRSQRSAVLLSWRLRSRTVRKVPYQPTMNQPSWPGSVVR